MQITNANKAMFGYTTYEQLFPEINIPMFHGMNNVGMFYGVPGFCTGYGTDTDYQGTVTLVFRDVVPSAHVFTLSMVYSGGVLGTLTAHGSGSTNIVLFAGVGLTVPATTDLGVPGIGFWISGEDTGTGVITTWPIVSFSISGYTGQTVVDAETIGNLPLMLTPKLFPDKSTYDLTIEEYRCVGVSGKVTFTGNDLQHSGTSAALHFEGGNPVSTGLLDYATLAQTRGNYNGPLKMGSYGWWAPESTSQFKFHQLGDHQRQGDPTLIFAGLINFSGEPSLGVLKMHVDAMWEAISEAQFYTYNIPPVDETQFRQALALAHMLPHVMENPLHLEKIRNFLRRVGQVGVQVGQFLFNHRANVLPLAKAIATAVGFPIPG